MVEPCLPPRRRGTAQTPGRASLVRHAGALAAAALRAGCAALGDSGDQPLPPAVLRIPRE